MRPIPRRVLVGAALILLFVGSGVVRAEVVEEIVAWVNGDIITRSELESEEEALLAEAYRRYTGDELDEQTAQLRGELLIRMIDRKILVQKARMMYDMEKMGNVFYKMFKEREGITDDEELKQALIQQGMTVKSLKERLIEMMAPEEVLRFEVAARVSVGDKEVERYYAENPDDFVVPAEVTAREIVLLAADEATKAERRAEAEEVRQRAVEAEDFGELAKEVSEAGTAETGGLLGPFERGELSEQLEEVAFSLPVGEVSELIELPHGFHILKVESRTEEHIRPLEEVRENLRRWLEDRKYYEEVDSFLQKARQESEWCVKPGYADRLPPGTENQTCKSL